MKIEIENLRNETTFGKIDVGSFFRHSGRTFIKISENKALELGFNENGITEGTEGWVINPLGPDTVIKITIR